LLQDLVDGALPNKAVARIEAHVADCLVCTNELAAWRSISVRLGSLEQFAPSEHFRERVVEAVLATQEQTSVAQRPAWSRLAAAAGRWVPQTREAWAALSGVAVTPVVIVGLMAYAVFSHPTLTVGSLLSFARWQVSDLATAALTALSAAALQNASGLGVSTLLEMLVAAPVLVAGGVLIYTVASAFAVRVLWRNLYAHASSAS
ncbi:MAG: zf-HC2 domain-containing protein, partial [Longimicrobiales bacterium]|nr:zf-HC2 domain-containing protein [Longimicrobiales bacterium]